MAIAVATPTIFPVPMVAARAVVKAPNWLTSPFAFSSFFIDSRIPVNSLRWGMPNRKVRKMCVPNIRMIIGHPHKKEPSARKKSLNASILKP